MLRSPLSSPLSSPVASPLTPVAAVSGGGGTWTPADAATTPTIWYRGTENVVDASGDVTDWNDKTSPAYNAEQNTVAKSPHTGTQTINSLNALEFDGVDDTLAIAAGPQFGAGTDMMVFVVADCLSTEVGRIVNFQVGTGTRLMLSVESGTVLFAHSSTFSTVSHARSGGAEILCAYRDGTERGAGVGGTYTTDALGADLPTFNGWHIGSYNGANSFFDGNIAEIIIAPAYDLTERRKYEGYLAHRYALTASLPSGHPYKSSAP